MWFTGIMSAFMDNVLAVATIAPIVGTVSGNFAIWWAVLFGACYMGNLTLIGSSANIVAHTYYEKNGGKSISFFEWLKYGSVVALVQMAVATGLMILVHVHMFPGA
jgi:Na+/H+ antiporter NhaD/arsenite permease-like protein